MRERYQEDNSGQMIFGTRAVLEAVKSGKEFERLFVQQGLSNPLLRELKVALQEAGIHYQYVPQAKLQRLTSQNHQGVIAYLSTIEYHTIADVLANVFSEGKVPLFIILDRITDTRNLGAIARTADGAGAHALIIPSRGSAMITADAMKTSAGALSFIPVCREDNLKETIDFLKDSGLRIISCTEKTPQLLKDVDFREPCAIIMGSEENGVSGEYIKRSTDLARIPMHGNIASYNVSVAAGMVLYEVLRQRG
jgi:23S rRNA (guanosine2251-2'-O)-methyltransferase